MPHVSFCGVDLSLIRVKLGLVFDLVKDYYWRMDPQQLREILREELEPIKQTQREHSKLLGEHSKILGEHSDKIDSLSGELHHVHVLAEATLDIVKARYEKNKREIDEIKDNLGMPKEPYFGE